MRALFDTNFLIDLVRFKIDLDKIYDFGVNELATLTSVEEELKKISRTSSKPGMFAKTSLELIKECKITVIKSNERPDNALLKLANANTIIATNDSELRKRLKALGAKTIYLKSKKHLAIG